MLDMLGSRSKSQLITTLGKSLINSDFSSPHLATSCLFALPTWLPGMDWGEGRSDKSAITLRHQGLCASAVLLTHYVKKWLPH